MYYPLRHLDSCQSAPRIYLYTSGLKKLEHLITQNNVSDNLAKFARDEGSTMTWLGAGPEVALSLAFDDCKDLVIA